MIGKTVGRFATGAFNEIASFERPSEVQISISPDGRSILYTQTDDRSADLMLVENFR